MNDDEDDGGGGGGGGEEGDGAEKNEANHPKRGVGAPTKDQKQKDIFKIKKKIMLEFQMTKGGTAKNVLWFVKNAGAKNHAAITAALEEEV